MTTLIAVTSTRADRARADLRCPTPKLGYWNESVHVFATPKTGSCIVEISAPAKPGG